MEHLPLNGTAVYNPGLWSPEELKYHFVARIDTLECILQDLRREGTDHPPRHRLILGLRGMGKSTLLRRIALAVEEDDGLCQRWFPLTFPEEQYNVAAPIDLWTNCLDALGDYLEEHGEPQAAAELDQAIERLPAKADQGQALQLLLDEAAKRGRRLLLLIDNIDLILDRLKQHHRGLREILEKRPQLKVIGASANAMEAICKPDSAFYRYFVAEELQGLSIDEMRATLICLSERGKTPQVIDLMHRDPARIRTLHTLTGGNPRTVVLLHSILARGLEGDVRSDLEGLLDLVTPLYKARFEELPGQGQQVVDALAVHWDPMTAKQLAEALGWEVNIASAQLSRLQQQAVVEKVVGQGKRAAFQIGERFFNIWYLMRASRRVRRKLIWLVYFLRMFFNAQELCSHAHKQLGSGSCRVRDAEYHLALAQALEDRPLRAALEHRALSTLLEDSSTREAIAGILDLQGEDAALLPQLERIRLHQKVRQTITRALDRMELDMDRENFCFRLLGSPALAPTLTEKLAATMAMSTPKQWRKLDQTLAMEYNKLAQLLPGSVDAIYRALGEGLMATADDLPGAEAAAVQQKNPAIAVFAWARWLEHHEPSDRQARQAEEVFTSFLRAEPGNDWVWGNLGELLARMRRYADSLEAYQKALAINARQHAVWVSLGNVLLEMRRDDEAALAYQRALDIDTEDTAAWYNLGFALARLRRFEESETAFRQAVDRNPTHAAAWNNLGNVLSQTGQFEASAEAYRRALGLRPNNATFLNNLGGSLFELQKLDEAEAAFRQVLTIAPGRADTWSNLGEVLLERKAFAESEEAFRRALTLEPTTPKRYNDLAWILYSFGNNLAESLRLARRGASLATEDDLPMLHTLATLLVANGLWTEAQPCIQHLLSDHNAAFLEAHWPEALQLFVEVVANGHADEACQLLDQTSTGERWRPLREALAAVAAGNLRLLNGVAPEVRIPALEILKTIAPEVLTR